MVNGRSSIIVSLKGKNIAFMLLATLSIWSAIARNTPWCWLVCGALGCTWLGEMMLHRFPAVSKNTNNPFQLALVFFASGHFLRILAFSSIMRILPTMKMPLPGEPLGSNLIWGVLPVFILFAVMLWILIIVRTHPEKPDGILTLVYALVLFAMAAFANCAAFTGTGFSVILSLSSLAFLVSEICFAFRHYHPDWNGAIPHELTVSIVYFSALILLVCGTTILI